MQNDSVVIFNTENLDKAGPAGKKILTATTRSPLVVEFPLLGYSVNIDLINFFVIEEEDSFIRTSQRGYYFFQPLDKHNRNKTKKYEKERKKIYYNSGRHFCRSFYNNALKENGYLLLETANNEPVENSRKISSDLFNKKNESGQLIIEGFKDQQFLIYYFPKKSGDPINLKEKTKNIKNPEEVELILSKYIFSYDKKLSSSVRFLNDTSFINPDGTIPVNNILFSGYFSNNRIGFMLPNDYQPSN